MLVLFTMAVLSGCYSPSAVLPRGEAAYALMPAANSGTTRATYRIGVFDALSIRVFQEPDLSFEKVQVDASGNINFPLIGTIRAAGKDPLEVSDEIERGLGTRFIRSPQVVVGVVESAGQRFVVDGNVIEPGTYQIAGSSSLIEAVARAKGVTRVALTDKVVIFRQIDGQRAGAVFDLNEIRQGNAPDPEVVGGDTIVVGFSTVKGAYRDFLATAPLLNVFRNF